MSDFESIEVKRGDTWEIQCTRTDSGGLPVDLAGITIAAEMQRGSWTVSLSSEVISASNGTFKLTKAAAQTALVAAVPYRCDVEFIDSEGTVQSTETFLVDVVEDITNAA